MYNDRPETAYTVEVSLTRAEITAIYRCMNKFCNAETEVENLWWRKAQPDEQVGSFPKRVVDGEMFYATYRAFSKIQAAKLQASEEDPDGICDYQDQGF